MAHRYRRSLRGLRGAELAHELKLRRLARRTLKWAGIVLAIILISSACNA
jgi:hypothetical protein